MPHVANQQNIANGICHMPHYLMRWHTDKSPIYGTAQARVENPFHAGRGIAKYMAIVYSKAILYILYVVAYGPCGGTGEGGPAGAQP